MTALGVVLVWHQIESVKLWQHLTINYFLILKRTNAPSMAPSCHLQTSFMPWQDKSVLLKPQLSSARKIPSRAAQRDRTETMRLREKY